MIAPVQAAPSAGETRARADMEFTAAWTATASGKPKAAKVRAKTRPVARAWGNFHGPQAGTWERAKAKADTATRILVPLPGRSPLSATVSTERGAAGIPISARRNTSSSTNGAPIVLGTIGTRIMVESGARARATTVAAAAGVAVGLPRAAERESMRTVPRTYGSRDGWCTSVTAMASRTPISSSTVAEGETA